MEKRRLSISLDLIQNYLYGKKHNVPRMNSEKALPIALHVDQYRGERNPSEPMLLPKQVEISQSTLPGENLGVFSTMWIKEGTQMGPYTGRLMHTNQLDVQQLNNFAWEMFDDCGRITHFIDGVEDLHQNWLCHVRCARFDQEQNLELVQIKDKIFYRAIKDVPPHQELLVWYGFTVHQFLGIPVPSYFEDITGKKKVEGKALSGLIQTTMLATVPGRLRCTVCRRGFNSRSNLRSHMRIHTLEKPFECKYCKKSFSQSSTLRNHTRLHTGEKPYNCSVCDMAYSQLAGLRAHQKSARHRPHGSSSASGLAITSPCRKSGCTQFPYNDETRSFLWTNRTQESSKPIEIEN